MRLWVTPLAVWRFVSPLVVCLALLLASSAGQAVRQEEGKPLQAPQLSRTGSTDLTNFSLASVPAIPFSAVIEAENTDTDASGTVTVRRYHTKVARDSRGRIRVDVDLNPEGGPTDARLLQSFIDDPVRKRNVILFHAQKLAIPQSTVPPQPDKSSTAPTFIEPPELSGMSTQMAQIEMHQEELAPEVLEGTTVRHGRQSATYPAEYTSLGHSATTITDYWFSPDLQVFLLVKQVGPGSTVHTLRLRNISRMEPAAALFAIPRGYGVSKPPVPTSQWHSYGYCPVP